MAEGVNVRFSGALKKFVEQRSMAQGLYGSASEYIRDLVRRDFEREEERRWDLLHGELQAGMEAGDSDFVPLKTADILAEARHRKGAN
jgi:antitoxin ParD1/3/4